jgi:hypothetical protein
MSNVKCIGYFGQSGAGKSTIIRFTSPTVGEYSLISYTNIIRSLYTKNPDTYKSPKDILEMIEYHINSSPSNGKIQQAYEKYIRSQFQLLNDYSTEVFLYRREKLNEKAILQFDRSPIDFYTVTVCGVEYLQSKFGGAELSKQNKHLLSLCKTTAENNTKNFFNGIYVTYPWTSNDSETLRDGVRDLYLSEYYTGDKWYGRIKELDLEGVKFYDLKSDVTDLHERAEIVNKTVLELI